MKYIINTMKFVGMILICLTLCSTNCEKKKGEKHNFEVKKGVTRSLAESRKANIKGIVYNLFFNIPPGVKEKIKAKVSVSFKLKNTKNRLVLDFKEKKDHLLSIKIKGKPVNYSFINGHIVLEGDLFAAGKNTLDIEFIAGDTSLNRNEEFLYTLFVPDRASTAFPCFDQPDLKAVYKLSLEVPQDWQSVANGKTKETLKVNDNRNLYVFNKTEPLSTYLFSFVCGKFKVITRKYKNNPISLYHRETDDEKINRNINKIFRLVFESLKWMENYTGIDYPFAKYDLIAIPSFQYGGMEHTGATLYRALRIFLPKSATINQELGRANLIAHETAHMWFGDLVTMQWFDDVWMKEVFANFMADKIINPLFPKLNHKLRFLYAHYPSSYSIDRTRGANPIAQKLENMNNAGTLYGQIIYHKAPIVMNHLEIMIGKEKLKLGLREYLKKYAYGNATYKDLINIISKYTEQNLQRWSSIWLDKAGMPIIESEIKAGKNKKIKVFSINTKDPRNKGRIWPQQIKIITLKDKITREWNLFLSSRQHEISGAKDLQLPDCVILNGGATAYGYFKLDQQSKTYLLNHIHSIKDPLLRGVAWINLWENLLNGNLKPENFITTALTALPRENNKLNSGRILGYLQKVYWNFLSLEQRNKYAPEVEKVLWDLFTGSKNQGVAAKYFNTYVNVFLTEKAIKKVLLVWQKNLTFKNFFVSPQNYTDISFELAVREVKGSQQILFKQLQRIKNPDRKKRMKFIIKALNDKQEKRDHFFESLKKERNRQIEPWVTTALSYLNHPLRRKNSIKYIIPSLEILQEIQVTGDIFFPITWLNATLSGFNSQGAADIVRTFLKNHPDYPQNLRLKILQASDLLFRSSKIITN